MGTWARPFVPTAARSGAACHVAVGLRLGCRPGGAVLDPWTVKWCRRPFRMPNRAGSRTQLGEVVRGAQTALARAVGCSNSGHYVSCACFVKSVCDAERVESVRDAEPASCSPNVVFAVTSMRLARTSGWTSDPRPDRTRYCRSCSWTSCPCPSCPLSRRQSADVEGDREVPERNLHGPVPSLWYDTRTQSQLVNFIFD